MDRWNKQYVSISAETAVMTFAYNPHPYKGRSAASHKIKPPKPPQKKSCCAMVEAGRAARRGKFKLAGRYALLGGRLIAARAFPVSPL